MNYIFELLFCFLTSKVVLKYVISDIGIGIGYLILDYKNIGYLYRVRISYWHNPAIT